jgi:hypothetical protein
VDVVETVFWAVPNVFLAYGLFVYIKWRSGSPPSSSFAKDYWYTEKNPLHRSWWPTLAILIYMCGVLFFGLT